MRVLALPTAVAVVGVCLVGAIGGDPRAVRALSAADWIDLCGLLVAVAVGVTAWRCGRRRSAWLIVPAVVLAIVGGMCGWIAGAEFTLAPDTAVHLRTMPLRVLFMVAMTAVGMSLLPAVLVWIAGLGAKVKPLGTART
jgi:hypothetical protein